MIRLHRHSVALPLLCGAALLVTNCGGGDDDSGTSSGASGGKAGSGSGGKGGTAGKAGSSGSSGESGANGEGGAGASTSSGGKGGKGGSGATGGTTSPGGAAGDAGAPSATLELNVADSATKLIEADAGGTVTLGTLTLVIPPDALAEDTEITIRSFEETGALFVLEPNGLDFEAPITARFTFPASELGDPVTDEVLPIFTLETGPLDEPMELVESTSVSLDEDDNYSAEGELSHFSSLLPRFALYGVEGHPLVRIDDLTVSDSVDIPVGVQFNTVAVASLGDMTPFDLQTAPEKDEPAIRIPAHLVPTGVTVTSTFGYSYDAVAPVPPEIRLPLPGGPASLEDSSLMLSRQFECTEVGTGIAAMVMPFVASFDATTSGYAVHQNATNSFSLVPGLTGSRHIELTSFIHASRALANCVAQPSLRTALRLEDTENLVEPAWQDECTWLSDHSSCETPDPARAITNALHLDIEVGPDAATRIEDAFPCGDGPIGKTLCGTPGDFAEGEYVFVLATFGDDIPLEDATSYFQHAVVFDADGDEANNYEPPLAYPDDFFGGTDKWYQLFYTPTAGFSLKVVDARISTSNAVSSNARMVIAGRELAAFIPRAELDGADPGCRVSTFRHESDYGLDGGPWDASYHPPLGEPLMPAAGGDVSVLPED